MTNRISALINSLVARPTATHFRNSAVKISLCVPLAVLTLVGCHKSDTTTLGDWRARSEFEGVARNAASSFVIGTIAYLGTGSDNNSLRLKDFWSYDQARNAWTQKADFTGPARYGGVGFAAANKGYIGTGLDENGNRLKDFYQYDPATNAWVQVADFGGTGRTNAVAFAINDKGYVGTGYDGNYTKDFWSYDPTANAWTKIASYSGAKRIGAVAMVLNNLGYVGTGNNNGADQVDWYAYDPAQDTWIEKDKFTVDSQTIQRSYGVAFVINGKGYITMGTGSGAATNWEYDPTTDNWTDRGGYETFTLRSYAVGFAIGNKGYVTTGGSGTGRYDDLLEYDPAMEQDTSN